MRRAVHGDRTRPRIGAQESPASRRVPERAFTDGELGLVVPYGHGVRAVHAHPIVGHDPTVLVAAPAAPRAGEAERAVRTRPGPAHRTGPPPEVTEAQRAS